MLQIGSLFFNENRVCVLYTKNHKMIYGYRRSNKEEIKIISAVLKFSIAACPTDSISNDVEIDADKLDKLAQKMDKNLE